MVVHVPCIITMPNWGGGAFFFEDVLLVEFVYLVFTMPLGGILFIKKNLLGCMPLLEFVYLVSAMPLKCTFLLLLLFFCFFEYVRPLVKFMYPIFTQIPDESYRRRFSSVLLSP